MISVWVRQHGTAVEESDYSNSTNSGASSDSGSGTSSESHQSAVHRLDPSDVG